MAYIWEDSTSYEDQREGKTAANYCPITCLPQMWKLPTGSIAEGVYEYLEIEEVLLVEQKG